MEGWVVLHFDFFSSEDGLGFNFVGFLLKERGRERSDFVTIGMGSCRRCGGVHTIGKERGGLSWVSIWGRSEVGGARRREEPVVSGSN